MPIVNRNTGRQGSDWTPEPAKQLGGLEQIAKRKTGKFNDYQDQELLNIKEHFRCMNQGFKQLRQGRTH